LAATATRRLFFALWPDETLRGAFASGTREAVEISGGRPVAAGNLHATLLFLGSVVESRIPELELIAARSAVAARSAHGSSQLVFDRIEYWKKSQLLVATTGDIPQAGSEPLARLAQTLCRETVASGFTPDVNPIQKFRPHVTLARKVHHRPHLTKMGPLTWSFADFVLVDSKTLPQGSVYTVLQRFPFGP
jgi:2'-5' RNA ligase